MGRHLKTFTVRENIVLINSSKTILCIFQYFDLNNDSYHDLLIGATLRSDDPTEMIEKGRSVSVLLSGS